MSSRKPHAVRRGKHSPASRQRAVNAAQATQSTPSRTGFLQRLAAQAGMQFGGKRDTYAAAGYIRVGEEKFSDYWGQYVRGEIAGRIVDLPAKTTWRTPPKIIEEGKAEEGTEFTKAFDAMAKKLRLWHYFQRVDRLCGVGRYAVIFIGTKGSTDQDLKQELRSVNNADDILYLSVYHEENARIETWEEDVASPRFGLPKTYKLKTGTDRAFKRGAELIVDASRIIHVAEDLLEDDTMGRPRLRRALNRLFDLDKISASTGEAYWQAAVRILQAKISPDAEVGPDQLKELDENMSAMVHDLKRHFYGQGVELQWLPEAWPNVSQTSDFYFSLIAAAADTPKRILFGSEIGQLASSTDQATYFGMINERQEGFAEPAILRAFVDKMIGIKALPKPGSGEYKVEWPPLYEEDKDGQAGTSLKVAQTAAALTPVGGDPLEMVTIDSAGVVKLIERSQNDALPDSHLPAEVQPGAGAPGTGSGDGSTPPDASTSQAGTSGTQAGGPGAGVSTRDGGGAPPPGNRAPAAANFNENHDPQNGEFASGGSSGGSGSGSSSGSGSGDGAPFDVSGPELHRELTAAKLKWDAKGFGGGVAARAGRVPADGPVFLSTDPGVLTIFDDSNSRMVATYTMNPRAFLTVGTPQFERNFPGLEEDLGAELYSDPPKKVLDYIKQHDLAGIASVSGSYIRVEDRAKAELKLRKVLRNGS